MPLKRILGAPTAWFIGMGVAIGSGVFRTPGDVSGSLDAPWLVLAAWLFGGVFMLMAGMVTAELATRYSEAGGEYVFLREAYGEFVAFFFGWAYTLFIVGGGAATIAAAFGDFGCEFLGIEQRWSGGLGAAAIVVVTALNAMGLRIGAGAQNVLTCLKLAALLGVIALGLVFGSSAIELARAPTRATGWSLFPLFAAGALPALWAYSGTTDSVKMAEEIRDVHRALPRALIGSALSLTAVYLLFNVALMRVVPLEEMAGLAFVPGEAMARLFGPAGRTAMLAVAMLVCLGALSSTVLATIRVTFALARDGLTFRFMARMSRSQAPVPALIVVGAVSVVLVWNREFEQVLGIYFFAAAVLFGLSYASLIVFRLREGAIPAHVFRCPAGPIQAGILILCQSALAVYIAWSSPHDAAYSTLMLVGLGVLYVLWKRGFNSGRG